MCGYDEDWYNNMMESGERDQLKAQPTKKAGEKKKGKKAKQSSDTEEVAALRKELKSLRREQHEDCRRFKAERKHRHEIFKEKEDSLLAQIGNGSSRQLVEKTLPKSPKSSAGTKAVATKVSTGGAQGKRLPSASTSAKAGEANPKNSGESVYNTPSHWRHPVQRDLREIKPGRKCVRTYVTDDKNSEFKAAIEKLVYETWKGQFVGVGEDAKGLRDYNNIEVKEIRLVENAALYRRYVDTRRRFLEHHQGRKAVPLEDVFAQERDGLKAGTRHEGPLLTTTHSSRALKDLLNSHINEVFAFHGTLPETVDAIVNDGFDERFGNSAWYGKGIYLCDSSTKADQYADPKDARDNSTDKYMLVVRTILGNSKLSVEPQVLRRAPCLDCPGLNDVCEEHEASDSNSLVHVRQKNNFREVVIYDRDQCYPEFIVKYRRVTK